jgi:hypothetical protein
MPKYIAAFTFEHFQTKMTKFMCRVTSLADVINKPLFFVPLVTTVPNLLISSYSPE